MMASRHTRASGGKVEAAAEVTTSENMCACVCVRLAWLFQLFSLFTRRTLAWLESRTSSKANEPKTVGTVCGMFFIIETRK